MAGFAQQVSIRTRSKYPSSPDSEKGLLGSILLSPLRVLDICEEEGISNEWLYDPANQVIFDSLLEMRKLDSPIDLISLTQYLDDKKRIDQVGGPAYVTDLFTFVPSASNVSYYIQVLRDKFVLRTSILEAESAQKALRDATSVQEAHAISTSAFRKTMDLCEGNEGNEDDKQAFNSFMDRIESVANGTAQPKLLTTGIDSLDAEAGGMSPGELYVIHGLTSTGKSLCSQRMLQRNVIDRGMKGSWYSFEMGYDQCMRRLIASEGSISLTSMRRGKYTKGEMDSFARTAIKIQELPLSIYDIKRCKNTASAVLASIRAHKRRKGLDITVLDYLQLLRFKGASDKVHQDLQAFTSELKILAGELDLVIVLVAQANKEGGVFNSTQVESDADGVLNMVPVYKEVGGVKRVVGTDGLFVSKFREAQRGRKIPIVMKGEFAQIFEKHEP